MLGKQIAKPWKTLDTSAFSVNVHMKKRPPDTMDLPMAGYLAASVSVILATSSNTGCVLGLGWKILHVTW